MLAALVVGAVAAPASASSFSTAPRVKERTVSVSRLLAVRAGRHAGFDRVVFELRGTPPGYRIQYVPKVVQDGSGLPVALTGKAFIQVVLSPTSAHLDSGAPSWPGPKRFSTGFPAITFPGGFSAPTTDAPIGVPVGIELLGPEWGEPVLIRLAFAYEQLAKIRRPPLSTPPLSR